MYHDAYVDNKSESGLDFESANSYKITNIAFESQIKAISEVLDKKGISRDSVRFTFDDGGVSFYTIYAPILEKYGFKGYFFIATEYLNKEGFLSEKQVVELYQRGHYIGSHSHSHRQMMTSLPREEQKKDWERSIDILSNLIKKQVHIASLPNGFCSKEMLGVLDELGISEVYTSNPTENINTSANLIIYGRYGIKDGMSTEDVIRIIFNPFTKSFIKIKKTILKGAKYLLGHQYIKIREFLYRH